MSANSASGAVRKGSLPQNTFEAIYQGASQKVAYTGTQGVSTALSAGISVVRLVPTSNCHVKIGPTPVALADGSCMYLPLGVPVLVGVLPGDKVAAIQDTAGGNLFITEGATDPA